MLFHKYRTLPLLICIALISASCGTPAAQNDSDIATAVALTVQAQNSLTEVSALPTLTPVPVVPATVAPGVIPTDTPGQVVSNPGCVASAELVSENPPDDTLFLSGEYFWKTWTFLNRGTCVWDKSYSLVFREGELMGGLISSPFSTSSRLPALRLIQDFGKDAFRDTVAETQTATDILYHDELEQYSGRELLNELRQTLIGRGVCVPTVEGDRPFINLDNGASTPTFTPIRDAVRQAWRQPTQGQQGIVNDVKSICAEVLGAPLSDYDVIFTANTTEGINLVAESMRFETEQGSKPVVVNTILEHNSNELPWRTLPGFSLIRLPVDDEGFVDLNELDSLLCSYNQKAEHGRQRIKLVAVSGASNVLGVFNDLAVIGQIVHRYGARLLVDAAQLVAHR